MPPASLTAASPAPARTAQDRLSGRLIVVFTGLCYLCVAVGFSYLDRRYGHFQAESLFWLAWAALGFTAGSFAKNRAAPAGKGLSVVLTVFAVMLAIFPAFFMYMMLRWACVLLLLVTAARAPVMHTRRDLYLCLTTCFTVSFVAAAHGSADWTLWFYLGPAWIFAGLALTWDYAPSRAIGHATRLGMNLGFVAATTLIAALLFFFVPRPPVLGFGFIPPAADASGLLGQPAGNPSGGAGTGQRPSAGKASGPGEGQGKGEGEASGDSTGEGQGSGSGQSWQDRWQDMLGKMRPALKDPAMPQWQKNLLEKLLALGEMPGDGQAPSGGAAPGESPSPLEKTANTIASLLALLLALVLAWLIYRWRYWVGIELLHFGAWLSAPVRPLVSMRLSAQAIKLCLREAGHKSQAGQSVREYVAAAPGQPPLVRRWLGHAVELYCETRFGAVQATPARANSMRRAVSAATQVVKGYAPELRKP
jgi:hypothetical protein